MAHSDVGISERVRRVLSRYRVDPIGLRFTCTRGTVRFHGTLRRTAAGDPTELRGSILETITDEIRRIGGVKRVYFTGVSIEDPGIEAF